MARPGSPIDRRRFVGALPALALLPILDRHSPLISHQGQQTGSPRLPDPFTEEERTKIAASTMAGDIVHFAGQGLNCAECVCITGIRYLERPEEEARLAMGFGGGLGHGELCGLLTGALMALGAAAGAKGGDRSVQRRRLRLASEEFWSWWTARAPLVCRELRSQYGSQDEFLRMAQRVAAQVETLIDTMV